MGQTKTPKEKGATDGIRLQRIAPHRIFEGQQKYDNSDCQGTIAIGNFYEPDHFIRA